MASRRRARRRFYNASCRGKVRYPTRAAAQIQLRLMLQRGLALQLKGYFCRFCRSYHIGHPRGSGRYLRSQGMG